MVGVSRTPSLGRFLIGTILGHLVFAVPVFCALVAFRLLSMRAAAVLFPVLLAPGSMTAGFLSWLMVRSVPRSSGRRYAGAACSVGAQLYLFLAGGLIGSRIAGLAGGTTGGVFFFLLGTAAGHLIGGILWDRLVKGG
jgi:hypothetical protein